MLVGHAAERLQEARGGRDHTHVGGNGSARMAARVDPGRPRRTAAGSFQGTITVAAVAASGTPGLAGIPWVASPIRPRRAGRPRGRGRRRRTSAACSRPVAARARRIALIAASVPEEVIRIISTAGIRAHHLSASSTSPSVGAPNVVPRAAAALTAATTAGCAWPRISGPQEQTQSTYSLPSTSTIAAPRRGDEDRVAADRAHRTHRGLTPPGSSASARRTARPSARRC